jgi:hypothetical protein
LGYIREWYHLAGLVVIMKNAIVQPKKMQRDGLLPTHQVSSKRFKVSGFNKLPTIWQASQIHVNK